MSQLLIFICWMFTAASSANPSLPHIAGQNNVEADSLISVIAQPFSSTISLVVTLHQASTVTVTLRNVIGQDVKDWQYQILDKGEYHLELTNLNLSSGVYFLSFYTPTTHTTQKVLYVR